MEAQRSLIADLETAIASGSPDHRVETLRRVTDLFMIRAEDYSDPQVELFDDVIVRLADKIETKARAELASRLAPVKNAPIGVVRNLARDPSIDVAGPVLTYSARLTDDDLLECARGNSQERLLAISKRASIGERVSDVLVTQGNQEVVRSVARNQGARFSHMGFGKLVERSVGDEELAVTVGLRNDIPKEHFKALVAKASEAVAKKLAAGNPALAPEVNKVLSEITGQKVSGSAVATSRKPRDYEKAKAAYEQIEGTGKAVEQALQSFAATGKFEEAVVTIASLSQMPIDAVEKILSDKSIDNDVALLLVKAAGLSWPTARAILEMRGGEGGIPALTIDAAHRHFEKLQMATAKRVVRFYQVRQASGDKAR